MIRSDIAVLGAGPAGCVVARQLGKAGLEVVVIDPLDRSAGHLVESFPASGAQIAEEIGLLETICSVSEGPASAITMRWRHEPERRDFGQDGPLLIRRAGLHAALRRSAKPYVTPVCAAVRRCRTTESDVIVSTTSGDVMAKLVIDARGRRRSTDLVHQLVALPFSARTDASNSADMYLEAFEAAWLWGCALDDGTLSGAVFLPPSSAAGLARAERRNLVATYLANSVLPAQRDIAVHRPISSGLSAVSDPVPDPATILIGDAALARDPIGSHGLVHAIRSAVHAAVAAQTILDPNYDSSAAFSFLKVKHREAVVSAKKATSRAYADQSLFRSGFWRRRGSVENETQPPLVADGVVELFAPLAKAPMLAGDRIVWAPALEVPANQSFATHLGPIRASEVASACTPSAPLEDVAQRLSVRHPRQTVFQALEVLLKGGALVQARRSE